MYPSASTDPDKSAPHPATMDLQRYMKPESTAVSTVSHTESAPYPGAFFPRAGGFTINGGVFTSNVTNNVSNPPLEEPAAFRTILLGDLDLIKEIHLDNESGVVGRQKRGGGIRRMYTAEIVGSESRTMTVAVYQGHKAEEEWRQHVAKYESIRHPHIMKLYGLVKNQGLRAMVFLNELIPFPQFLKRFEHSRILTSYIYAYCASEWWAAIICWNSVSPMQEENYLSFPVWIRPATGELCVDLVQGQERSTFLSDFVRIQVNVPRLENISSNASDAEAAVILNLYDDELHELFSVHRMTQDRWFPVSAKLSFQLEPTIFRWNIQPRTLVPITEPLGGSWIVDYDLEWSSDSRLKQREPKLMTSSWTRYHSSRVSDLNLAVYVVFHHQSEAHKSWLAQANHIFAQLGATSHFEDYICATGFVFTLRCLPNTYNNQKPTGYLFVCPPEFFRIGQDSLQWPHQPAYWSLDPSGAARLSTEDARTLGFPIIHIETTIYGLSWDDTVYDKLRLLHRSKGFDPNTQEAARHLGYPLFELCRDAGAPFACGEVTASYRGRCVMKDAELCQELGHYL
ncbi:hypothetical protein B0H14DRAFT_445952 [Mycena olivaceomarginata]|nr:hypothetical protein B0H14DRAFT_445952 [Mycena olivaceomarginata]